MKLNITLEDPKLCDGCPCREDEHPTWQTGGILHRCRAGYKKAWAWKPKRPQRCIKENGK